jgi:hypothetical protein
MNTMSSLAKIVRTFAIAAGLAAVGMATSAQAQNSPCGVTGSASAAPVVYDPFNPSGLASTTITVNLTRVNTTGGGDTRIVNFYLRANSTTGAAADGTSITPISVVGQAAIEGIGLNIFHNYNGPFPTLPLNPINGTPTGANRYMENQLHRQQCGFGYCSGQLQRQPAGQPEPERDPEPGFRCLFYLQHSGRAIERRNQHWHFRQCRRVPGDGA